MLQKIKKNKKLILIPVSVILAIAVVLGVVISDVNTTLAKATLPGVESIIIRNNNDNPYTILEVVPNYEDARLGYLIGGEEPTHDGKARSIKDMPSSAERLNKIKLGAAPDYATGKVSIPNNLNEAVSFEDPYKEYGPTETTIPENKRKFEIRGSFFDVGASNGNYEIIPEGDRYTYVGTPESPINTGSGSLNDIEQAIENRAIFYTKYAVFNKNTDDAAGYELKLKKLYIDGFESISMPNNLSFIVGASSGTADDKYYTGQYFVAKKVEFSTSSTISTMSRNPEETAIPAVSPSVTPDVGGEEPTISPSTESTETATPTVTTEPTPEITPTPADEPSVEPAVTSTVDSVTTETDGQISAANKSAFISSTTSHYMNYYGVASVPTNVNPGDGVFTENAGVYTYLGYCVESDSLGLAIKQWDATSGTVIEKEFDNNNIYYIISEADANSAQDSLLYIYSVSWTENSIYKLETTYNVYPTDQYGTYGYLKDTSDEKIKKTHFYVAAADDLGYAYAGDNNDKYLFDADYSLDPLVDPIVYTGGFTNNEWFKKYVFDLDDSQIDDMIIDVKTVTYSDLTEDLVDKADFVYFAGVQSKSNFETTPGPYIGDINDDVAKKLLSRVCSSDDGLPIVINRSLFIHNKVTDNDINSAPCLMNLDRLVLLLIQNNIQIPSDTQWGDYNFWVNAKNTIRGFDIATTHRFTSGGYVNGNLFVFDDFAYDASGNPISYDTRMLISNAFIKQDLFSEAERNAAENYKPILDEINSENFYLEVAGKTERISTDITPAAAFRYIINFGDHRNVTKTSLRVLDLEPYDFSKLADADRYKNLVNPSNGSKLETIDVIEEVDSICLDNRAENDPDVVLNSTKWLVDNLVSQFAGNQDKISVDIMGSKEFIGRNIDLNANYDLIYIGMDTTVMNTEIATVEGKVVKKANTIYNDTNMNGLVYAHVGDVQTVKTPNNSQGNYRLSGNDITSDKVRELKEFVEAGYAVIISDKSLVKNSDGSYSVNTATVDKSSNMYKFLSEVALYKTDGNYKFFGKNVRLKSDFESQTDAAQANRDDFSRYLSISKLNLEYSEADLPEPYNHDDGNQTYLPIDSDGVYRLKYKITLSKDAAVGIADTSYDCKLYIDTNVDGRYHVDECMTGLTIKDAGGSEMYVDDNGKYHLSPGHSYEIVKEIPDGYTGFLSWKLEFLENQSVNSDIGEFSKVRNSLTGYCAVPCGVNKPEINIIQLISGDGVNNLDLSNSAMDQYYSQVPDYKINVSQMTFKEFINKDVTKGYTSAETSYIDFLNSYDMIVMGFRDMYTTDGANADKTSEAVLAIREYALSGRSILFTHDLTSFTLERYANWGNYLTPYLRDVQGMDRYNWSSTFTYKPIPDENKYKYTTVFDESNLKGGSTGEIAGYSSTTILDDEWGTKRNLSEISRYSNKEYHNTDNPVRKVSKLNSGQITEYPFKIEDELPVSKTHGQYFQLNMETDSRDDIDNDDVVVWYTLSHDAFYDSVPMDGRNNYYIFNKGNITYTGSGHSSVTSDGEKKLFVNTLVAAYRTGLHAPKVYYKEAEYKTSATITSKYIPYDTAINGTEVVGYVGNTLDINFLVSNINLQNSNTSLSAKYYTDATAADATLCLDGKYYKEIHPVADKFIINIPVGKDIIQEAYAKPNLLKNDFIYSASFTYADLGLNNTTGIRPTGAANIYIRLGYEELIDSTDASNTLKGDESMTKLSVTTTQLFELK
ncbi:MAG: DUF5057 domain-containing protein [Lachnospiraceae bacterium]|nr:DUF5057 domain-containing protein [Lachnospiraceae bacterium]